MIYCQWAGCVINCKAFDAVKILEGKNHWVSVLDFIASLKWGKCSLAKELVHAQFTHAKKLMMESGYYVLFFMPFCFYTDNFAEQTAKLRT